MLPALIILAAGQALGQPKGAVTVTPSQLQFPTAQVGSVSAPATVTLTNTSAKLVLGISISFSGDFSDTTTCRSSLKAYASCQVSVTFAPMAPGLRSGNLTVTYNGQSAPAVVNLSGLAYALVSIAITPQTASIPIGAGRQFHALGSYSDGSIQDISASVTWTSSDMTELTVANSGVATGIAAGRAQIAATAKAVTASVDVDVTTATLVSLAVDTTQLSLPQRYVEQFDAVGTYSDGTQLVLTDQAAWTSSAPSVASVSKAGMVATLGPGAASITAAIGSVRSSAPLIVTGVTLQSIAISPATVWMAARTILQLQATGTYSDGSTRSLTNLAAWSSSATNIATVSAIGRIRSGGQTGSATISASFAGLTASAAARVSSACLNTIAVAPGNLSLPLAASQNFSATGRFSDGSSQDVSLLVHWMSSSAAAAIANTVLMEGLANAVAPGSATITASYLPSVAGKATVTAGTAALVSIAIAPSNPSVVTGTALQFRATGTFDDRTTYNLTRSVTWSSADPGTVLVGNDQGSRGVGYGLAAGHSTVTATLGSIGGSTSFIVAAPNLISIGVSPQSATIVAGTTQQFTATGTYSDGSTQDLTATATWSASASTVATVSDSPETGGLALGVAQGQAAITAASGVISGSSQLTVTPAQLIGIAVTPANPTITAGGSQQFTAIGTYTDGSTNDLTASVTWSASPAAQATIGSQGLAQGVAAGQATIRAASGAIAGSTLLTVNPAPLQLISISISPSSATVFAGSTQQFTAAGKYSDGSTRDLTNTVTWRASPSTVATIGNAAGSQGLVQALAPGTATITATSGSISATAQLSVMALLTSITVSPSPASVGVGGTQQFTATGAYSDGSTQDLTTTATWSASPATAATIGNAPGSQGLAQAVGTGSATIAASFASTTGSATLTVTPALTGISVTPANAAITAGSTQQFAATGTYSDGSTQDLTNQVTWSAAPASVATIGPSGLAHAMGCGQSTITAILGTISNSASLTVSTSVVTLVSLAVSPSAPAIGVGGWQQFYATGIYSDGTTQDLTSAATWTSFSPKVATIGSSGLATALTVGTTTINAGFGAIAASAAPLSVVATVPPSSVPPLCEQAATGLPPLLPSATLAVLPQSCTVPVFPTPTSTVAVSTAADLQTALTNAQCGQWIIPQAGLTYEGNFTVPGLACPAEAPVLLAGSAIATLPQWIVPSRSLAGTNQVATLATARGVPVLLIADGAANWYFAGLEFTLTPAAQGVYPIVEMGLDTTTVEALPRNITFDRVLVHPAPCPASGACNYTARGIDINVINGAVISSAIWGIVNTNQDTQAVSVTNSPGPILISNNDLEASGENIILNTECPGPNGNGNLPGYGIPSCPPPSDVTITRNRLSKQAAWLTLPTGCGDFAGNQCYDVKNSLECKHCQRVLADSNVFDTTFFQGQHEFIIQNCRWPGPYVCTDMTFTNNLFEHGPELMVVTGNGNSQTGQRTLFRNNLAIDIDGVTWGSPGAAMQIQNTDSLIADHNTIINRPPVSLLSLSFSDAPPSSDTNFQWTNNIIYGQPFANGMYPGPALADLPNALVSNDVLVGDWWPNLNTWGGIGSPAYPPTVYTASSTATPVAGQLPCNFNNKPLLACWPLDWALVGFVDFSGGNSGANTPGLELSPSSPYHNAASDGMDIGANVSAVLAAVKGVQ